MIKSVMVINKSGEALVMDLYHPELTGIAINSITGIGPGNAEIKITESAANDGAAYNSARRPSRNIVFDLTFLHPVERVRHLTYQFFPLKDPITIVFETDERICAIDGHVESNEPNIFSESEGSTISIICENPYFRSSVGQSVNFIDSIPSLEFPMENKGFDPAIEVGGLQIYKKRTIYYEGDVNTGMIITIFALGDFGNVTLNDLVKNDKMDINTEKIRKIANVQHFNYGDKIVINTVKGRKSAYFITGDKVYSILNALTWDSNWISIDKGINVFSFSSVSGEENIQISFSNDILYMGV